MPDITARVAPSLIAEPTTSLLSNRLSSVSQLATSTVRANFDGTLSDTPITRTGAVDTLEPNDVFQFNINGTRDINLSLTNIRAGGDADLYLYRDNGDGVFNPSNDQFISSSIRGGNQDDAINTQAQGGTYFAEVHRFAGSNVSYNLALSSTPVSSPSNLLPREVDLGNLSGTGNRNLSGNIGNSNTSDVYHFSIGSNENVNINLTGLSNDADIRLISDNNRNRIVDSGEEISRSARGSSNSENLSINRAGDYLLQVYQFAGNTAYNLGVNYSHA